MKKYNRTMVLAASTITALGTLPVASLANAAPPALEVVAFPVTGTYLVDLPSRDGMTTTLAITVDGNDVAAYATNGVDDEAYFSGAERDGSIDLMSTDQDRLVAAFDGTTVNGTVTMNGVAQPFTAPAVAAPAGIYTTELGDSRAAWVVRPDHSMVGMQDKPQLQPAPSMTYGTWSVDMNGTPMTAVPVTDDMAF